MARFFFDIHSNGQVTADESGTELPDTEAVRREAMAVLPAIAKDEVAKDGDRQTFAVHVTDEDGRSVYTATLNFAGLWLLRD